MRSYLHELENNEAILLMYLAGELPAQDRLEVEQMLASDAGLRAELENVRQTQDLSMQAMDKLDEQLRTPISEALAARQIVRMMNLRKVEKKPQPAQVQQQQRRFGWWIYIAPTAAAAVLAVVLYTVYSPNSPGIPRTPEVTFVEYQPTYLERSLELSDSEKTDLQLVAVGNQSDKIDAIEVQDPNDPSDQ